MNDYFLLKEIAKWQLNPEKSQVELPSIQRGFVWKTKQVEDLWDSLLRGYPIGSFLFSKTGEKLYLMDGQQRSTSIFLGYFNPFDTNSEAKAWSIKGQLPVVWVDIKPNSKPNTSKYSIRLTTQSHPWGYQATSNETKLSISDRKKALDLFKKHPENKGGYTSFKNSTVFPYDCCYPIPLSFLIESENVKDVLDKLKKYLPDYFSTKSGNFDNKDAFIKILESNLHNDLVKIFDTIKLLDEIKIKSNIIEERVLSEENETENPTLFVRINSSGTTLTGDDLIFSIYKSMFPEAKNLIENVGLNFIPSTQVLSLTARIVVSDLEKNNYVKKMSVKDFQRRIKNEDFKSNLKKVIETGKIKELFSQAINILSCKDNSLFEGEIPPVIIKQFINKQQELFLFLIYWLHLNKIELSEQIKLRMCAKMLSFAWFDFGNILQLWNENIRNDSFFNEALNKLIWWNENQGIHFLIEPKLLREYYLQDSIADMFVQSHQNKWGLLEEGIGKKILEYFDTVKSKEIEFEKANEYFWKFIDKIKYNKQLILFAQRNYINEVFVDFNQMEEIEDSNVPWDWDHIYPNSWVYNMKYCEQVIRDWNGTNGNFRAISLEHNRSRSNQQSPKNISDTNEREYSYIQENDWEYWKNIDDRIWDKSKAIFHFRAVTTRMINMYEKFWKDLKLSELIQT